MLRKKFVSVNVNIPVIGQTVYVSKDSKYDYLTGIPMKVTGFKCNPWSEDDDTKLLLVNDDGFEGFVDEYIVYSSEEVSLMDEDNRNEYLDTEDNLDCWIETKKVKLQILEIGMNVFFKKEDNFFSDEFNIEQGVVSFENVVIEYDSDSDILKFIYLIDRPVGESLWVNFNDFIF